MVRAAIIALLLAASTMLVRSFPSVHAAGSIYIRADGSIEPFEAPISSLDNVTYILAADISNSIVVERNDIKLDGKGFALRGTGDGIGINVTLGNNITIRDCRVENFSYGIQLGESSNITICNNTIAANARDGIYLINSDHIILYGNTVLLNERYGIVLTGSSSNRIFHNNFVQNMNNNTYLYDSFNNAWDDGYPSGGNYWSSYTGFDSNSGLLQNVSGSDGIGDAPYTIDADNRDSYPLAAPISLFDAGTWDSEPRDIKLISNSTISNFHLTTADKAIGFDVTDGVSSGFCRIAVPNQIVQDLWQGNFSVLVDGVSLRGVRNWTDVDCTYIYFTYSGEVHEVIIVPEFPFTDIFILFLIAIATSLVVSRKGRKGVKIKKGSLCTRQNQFFALL